MHRADDAADTRQKIEEQALKPYTPDRNEPTSFAQKTVLFVLVDFLPETNLYERLSFTIYCDLWVDRNIFLREQGINPRNADIATAYWSGEQERFVITSTTRSLGIALARKLWLL